MRWAGSIGGICNQSDWPEIPITKEIGMGGAVSEEYVNCKIINQRMTSKPIPTRSGKPIELSIPSCSCPDCHHKILPIPLFAHEIVNGGGHADVFLICPNCNGTFISTVRPYLFEDEPQYFEIRFTSNLREAIFDEVIKKISQSFVKIYNEAFAAEQYSLFEICGVGYRKALEFLIKDYAISKNSPKKGEIEKTLLGQVIQNYIADNRIKSVAKRAAWLGNDETHYLRKWEGKNLTDLKKLIELTVHWIMMETLTESFEEDMPETR